MQITNNGNCKCQLITVITALLSTTSNVFTVRLAWPLSEA